MVIINRSMPSGCLSCPFIMTWFNEEKEEETIVCKDLNMPSYIFMYDGKEMVQSYEILKNRRPDQCRLREVEIPHDRRDKSTRKLR